MAGDDNVTAKAMKPPDPEEFLAQMSEDFMKQAHGLDQQANAAEDAMLAARARANCLRGAAKGVAEALENYSAHVSEYKDRKASREMDAAVPSKSGYAVRIPPEYR